jgi:hypothetical protein
MKTRVAAVLGVLALFGVSEAHAASKNFNFICTLNTSLRVCASVRVVTTAFVGGTNVTIFVHNHAGVFPDQTGGSLINRVALTAPPQATLGTASGLVVGTSGSVNVVGAINPANNWAITNQGLNGPVEFMASTGQLPNFNGGIIGCQNPPLGANVTPIRYFQTCNTSGFTGSVSFSFQTTGTWSAQQAEVGLGYRGVVGLTEVGANGQPVTVVECRTEKPLTAIEACASVTPEPISMALLGTGLLGLGGAGLRRRRKGMDVENA